MLLKCEKHNNYHHTSLLTSAKSPCYRYGFNGQEIDDEWKGEGNAINYKYRMCDPRLGRFFAIDPLHDEFAYNSTYAFCENQVISHIELEGLEKHKPVKKRRKPHLKNKRFDGTSWWDRLFGVSAKGKYHKNVVLERKKNKKPKSLSEEVEEKTAGDDKKEEKEEEEEEKVEIEMEQPFEADSDDFWNEKAAKEELDEAAKKIRKIKGKIQIEVGTSGQKHEWWARRLTWKRGRRVKKELKKRGVDPKQIKIKRKYDTKYKVVIKQL